MASDPSREPLYGILSDMLSDYMDGPEYGAVATRVADHLLDDPDARAALRVALEADIAKMNPAALVLLRTIREELDG